MIAELLQDVRTDLREIPGFIAMVVLAIAAGIGFNMATFYEADGDELRLSANRGQSIEEQMDRLRLNSCSAKLKPGFTVIVGLRQYSVELSVPMAGARSLFCDMRTNISCVTRGTEHLA